MGNKMCGSKKCDFMININVAVTTVRRGPSRGDGDGGIGDDVKRLNIASMLLSLSVINGETENSAGFCVQPQRKLRDT